MFGGISSRQNFNKSTNKSKQSVYGANGGYTVIGGGTASICWSSSPTKQNKASRHGLNSLGVGAVKDVLFSVCSMAAHSAQRGLSAPSPLHCGVADCDVAGNEKN